MPKLPYGKNSDTIGPHLKNSYKTSELEDFLYDSHLIDPP
jgi:hypothetical protein